MGKLNGKIAVVTGGGSGIGAAIFKAFVESGATVHILDLNIDGADKLVKEATATGATAFAHHCDVSKHETTVDLLRKIGRIDILVNNAGIAHIGDIENCTENDFDRIMSVNVKGAYNVLYGVIPLMKEQKYGVILNLASIASLVGIPDRFAYSTSKGAIAAMTLSVAKDYIKYNIRCNSISPARVHTPFVDGYLENNYPDNKEEMFEALSKTQPIGRMAKPEEVAKIALFLCSDEAGFITGNDYAIDGGFVKLNN